jgi:hypothetical protein
MSYFKVLLLHVCSAWQVLLVGQLVHKRCSLSVIALCSMHHAERQRPHATRTRAEKRCHYALCAMYYSTTHAAAVATSVTLRFIICRHKLSSTIQ